MPGNSARVYNVRPADLWSGALCRFPAFRGKTRVVNTLARFVVMARGRWATCSPARDVTVRIDLDDRIERQMWGGCYEPHVQRALRLLLNPGDVFLDIGAHIGYYSVLASALVGDQGRVIAFEADPGNFLRLRENLLPFPGASAINKAVWRVSGSIGFERSSEPAESGWGTLTDVRDLRRGDHLVVDAISLDGWFAENAPKVSVVKVDAEGSEVGILRGAKYFLRRNRPAIIVEANDVVLRQARTSALELVESLREAGFDIFEFDTKMIRRIGAGEAPNRNELLALPEECAQQMLKRLRVSGDPAAARGLEGFRQ